MLGARIAALRRQKNMNQHELARNLGISSSAVGMYEQGRREPPLRLIVAMARLFEVSTDYLLTGQCTTPADAARLRALFDRVMAQSGGLLLKNESGEVRPVSGEDVALALAALLGEPGSDIAETVDGEALFG